MLVTRQQRIHVSVRELKTLLGIKTRETITKIEVLEQAGDVPGNPVSISVYTVEPVCFKGIGK